MKIVNKSKRPRAIPGPIETVVLPRDGEMEVTAAQWAELRKNVQVAAWLHQGHIVLEGGEAKPLPPKGDERPGPELPEGLTGKGTEIYAHLNKSGRASGWYSVYHEGMPCTDEKVRKDRAEEIAAEYE